MDAAWSLMTGPGPTDSVTLTRLCGIAGCTPKVVYQHFESLNHVLGETSIRAFVAWAADIESAIGEVDDPAERLRRRGKAYVDWGLEHPQAYHALFDKSNPHYPGPDTGFVNLLVDLAELHGLAPDDPQVKVLGLAHWAAVHGLTTLVISRPRLADAYPDAYELLRRAMDPSWQQIPG